MIYAEQEYEWCRGNTITEHVKGKGREQVDFRVSFWRDAAPVRVT
jgi:hypothetical protein